MKGPRGRRHRPWERWLLRAALLTWPRRDREEAGTSLEALVEERRKARGSVRGPAWWDTWCEAANLAGAGLRLRFHSVRGTRELTTTGRRGMGVANVIRHGMRAVARSPGWSAVVVLVLAAALGSAVGVFTVVDSVALRPLPYQRPDELLRLGSTREGRPGLGATSGPNFRDLEAESTTLSSVAASVPGSMAVGLPGTAPELVRGGWVSGTFFTTLGRTALLGRTLAPSDDRLGAPLVVVVSHGLWQSRLGGASIMGRSLKLDGRTATVVGVMPADFHPPEGMHMGGTELWAPLARAELPLQERDLSGLDMIGRVASGYSRTQVSDELSALGRGIAEVNGLSPRVFTGFTTRPLRDETLGEASRTLKLLLGAVGLLLAIACLNVANLVLLRTLDRAESLRVRLSLGASRLRVVGEVTTETVILALGAGGLGTLAAWVGVGAVRRSGPVDLPRLVEVGLDARVALVALAVSLVVGLVVGVLPGAWVVASGRSAPLRAGPGRATSKRAALTREGLVLAQVAMGLALAVGAGLLMRSLVRLHQVDPGFDPAGLEVATFRMRGLGGDDFNPGLLDELQRRARAIPGVRSASLSSGSPYTPGGRVGYIDPVGMELGQDELVRARIEFHRVGGGHLASMGVPILQGRDIESSDRAETRPVVVISRSLARKYWPGGGALGAEIVVGGDGTFTPRTVVGIAGSPRYRGPGSDPEEHLWMPYTQVPLGPLDLVLRAEPGRSVREGLLAILADFDDRVELRSYRSVESVMAEQFVEPTFFATLLASFAAMALLLSSVGLYSTLAHAVQSRRRELGIRMALGADADRLVRRVVVRGSTVAALGVALGLGLAAAGSGLLEAFLFGTTPTEPSVWAWASGLMLAVGGLASWVPARMAGRVDPAISLRAE